LIFILSTIRRIIMETIALSKKNQKKIHKLVSKGQKKALKVNKQAEKIIHTLPSRAKKVYSKAYNPKELNSFLIKAKLVKPPKKSPAGLIGGVAAGVAIIGILVAAVGAALNSTDGFTEAE
jgi:hypothetical protein